MSCNVYASKGVEGRNFVFNSLSTLTVISGQFKVGGEAITSVRVQELCESRGGRPGLPVLMCLMVSAICGRKATLNHAHALVTVCP